MTERLAMIVRFRILLAVALEDAGAALNRWDRGIALAEAKVWRDQLNILGAVA